MGIRQERKDNFKPIKDSYITEQVQFQCRELIPERELIGKDENNNIIFLEETSGSLQKRHYGKSKKATSFNLIISNGEKAKLVTEEYLRAVRIDFKTGYNTNMMIDFTKNKNKRYNPLQDEKREKCSFYLSREEQDLVREFLKKVRAYKDENN